MYVKTKGHNFCLRIKLGVQLFKYLLNFPTQERSTLSESKLSGEANLAYVAILAKLFILALLPILLIISENSISPNATIFNRFWIATVLIAVWHGGVLLRSRLHENKTPIKLLPDTYSFLLLLVLAIVCGAYQLLWVWSLTQTSVANSELMHCLAPLFTMLLGWSLFGQKFDRTFLIGITIAITGAISLAANDFSINFDKLAGDGLALLSAFFWAISLLIIEKLRTKLNSTAITIWNSFLVTLFLIPISMVTGDAIFPHSFGEWLNVIILGVILVVNQVLLIYIFKWLSSSLVATVLLLSPILTAIFAWLIFSEALSLFNWLALLIILVGIYITTLSQKIIKT